MSRSLVKGCRGNLAVCSMASCSTNTNKSKRAGTRAVIAMHGVSVGTCHNTSHLMAWHHHGSWLLAHTWLGCNGAYAATVWQCLSGADCIAALRAAVLADSNGVQIRPSNKPGVRQGRRQRQAMGLFPSCSSGTPSFLQAPAPICGGSEQASGKGV